MVDGFRQDPAKVGNPFVEDTALIDVLKRVLPEETFKVIEKDCARFGDRLIDECIDHVKALHRNPPTLIQYDGWGHRIDEIRIDRGWNSLAAVSAEEGLVSIAYERKLKEYSRVHQFTKVLLFSPYSSIYTCPLSMADGAARLCELFNKQGVLNSAFEHLISRDPKQHWTSGQWMTERTGGSDVGNTETIARKTPGGGEFDYTLTGYKFFSSATLSEMAFALARIEDENGKTVTGSRGLSLFYIQLRDENNKLRNIKVHRLKEKLGTKALPTAELELCGTPAVLISKPGRGVPSIASMFNLTRVWSATCSLSAIKIGVAIARDYAFRRKAFGKLIAEHPLHINTLAQLEVMYRGHLQLIIHEAVIQGKIECGKATQSEEALMRILTPLGKLYTGKEAVKAASECIECLGGLGYMEDATILPAMLREQQVNVIWEGTTNILSLDLFRALAKDQSGLTAFMDFVENALGQYNQETVRKGLQEIKGFMGRLSNANLAQASARDLCYLMASTFIGALLIRQWEWSKQERDKNIVDMWADRYISPLLPIRIGDDKHLEFLKEIVNEGARGDVCKKTGRPRAKY
eukprot:TRINITY_DN3024_c0_g1_i2.p1 TRINITY_DN3024_c0_g1~~TRINITY_DN3024_c0_g1_i2.p1  ORF type:complete len:578 (-),score=99.99 TRINITY_DN3024_c0_g1_i2:81-1814(-)